MKKSVIGGLLVGLCILSLTSALAAGTRAGTILVLRVNHPDRVSVLLKDPNGQTAVGPPGGSRLTERPAPASAL